MIHYKNSNGIEYRYEYDSNDNLIHYKHSNGFEKWYEYDSNDTLIHYKNSYGNEAWFNSAGTQITKQEFDKLHSKTCNGKIIEIDGKTFQLKAI